ncbi:hypothetical protein ABPG72_010558 [Tetrahymena utriculariae]
MNSLKVQNILQTNCFLQDLKCRNSQVFQNDQDSKIENLDKVSASQSLKFYQLFGFENNTYVGTTTNNKNQNSTILQNKRDIFFKNLALLTRIKIQTTHYYKKFTNIYRTRLLDTQTRKTIQDLSDFIPEKINFCFEFFLVILEKSSCLTLFDIQQNQYFAFKLTLLIVNFFYFVILSLVTVYQVNDSFQNYFSKFICFLWIIEIVVCCNSKIYTNDQIINDRGNVILFYLKERMPFDLLALTSIIITLSIKLEARALILVRLISFTKLCNLSREYKILEAQLSIILKNSYYIQLIKILFQLFLVSHIISLIWYLLTYFDNQHKYGSQKFQFIENQNWSTIYFQNLYWSLTLINTGSNSYETPQQNIFVVFVMLFNIFIYGYFISSFCAIIYQNKKQNLKKSIEVAYLHKQLAQKNISNEFKMKINQYLDSYYKNADNLIYQLKIYQILPRELRDQLTLQMNIQLIKNIKCICNTYSLQTLEKLSLNCIDEIYLPGQIIQTQNQDDQYLFYIQEGQVEILNANCKNQKTQIPYEFLQKGDVFGEVGFFTGVEVNYFIKCIKTTKVLKIKRSEFMKIIKNNKEEFQNFCQTKDQILLYNDFKDIQLKCKFCQKFTHLTKDCQMINLNQKSFLYRIKINEQKIQQRRIFKRKLLFHHNSLNNLSINQMLAFKYQFNNDHENLKEMDLVEYLQCSWSQNQSQDISQYQHQLIEAQDQYVEEYILQKELEACNKNYGSYLKSEVLSQQAKNRSSIQSTKIAPLSAHEIDDQQGLEKKFNKMGTLDKPNLQQIEPTQHATVKENSKYENQKSLVDLDGVKKYKENNESPQVEQNDDVFTNTKASQHVRQTRGNSLSKIFLEVDNHSEYGWLSQKKKSQHELINKNIDQQKQSNLNSPSRLSRGATNKNTLVQIKSDQIVFSNSYYWQFDRLKNYQNYYASGNSNLVIEQFNKILQKNKINSKIKNV